MLPAVRPTSLPKGNVFRAVRNPHRQSAKRMETNVASQQNPGLSSDVVPANESQNPGTAKDSDPDEDIVAAWRDRVIDLGRLNWPLRLVIVATMVATGICTVLILLRGQPQPELAIDL